MLEQAISRVLVPEVPTSVGLRDNDHSSSPDVTIGVKRPTRELGRTTLKCPLIWSCSRWGLPSSRRHQRDWWALTSPFHPYPIRWMGHLIRRFPFCGTFLLVTETGRYPAPCPVEPGLSSPLPKGKAAVICPTLTYIGIFHLSFRIYHFTLILCYSSQDCLFLNL